jgi:protein TonB
MINFLRFEAPGMRNFKKILRVTLGLLVAFQFLMFPFSFGQNVFVKNEYEKGVLANGYKTGVWEYYDSLEVLELSIDYTNAKLVYLRPDTSDYVIYENYEWVKSKVDIPPKYIGSSVEFYKLLNEYIDYPAQARYRDVVGCVSVLFEVDTMGIAGNYEIVQDIGAECGDELVRVLKLLPNYWLVARKNGKAYKSRFIIHCDFGINLYGKKLEPRERKRKKTTNNQVIPLARDLDTISYTIEKGIIRD